ncbi:hypothetical protein HDU97_002264 [Phlyctochytrium planicorne]|nr:hypothetical protein HDU97_002264 [Phlyctochytrium planicorne]
MSAVTSVKVAVRVRPLNAKEILSLGTECVRIVPNLPQIVVGLESGVGGVGHNNFASKSFTFDEVFNAVSSQTEVYEAAVYPLVERFLEGFNSTALAYGQTGSGKTWSMGTGLDSANLPKDQLGIVPRAINDLYSKLEDRKAACPHGFKYSTAVSFLELYNEDLIDLLNPRPRTAGGSIGGPTIREDSQGNIIWGGVREEEVSSPDELLSCLQRGSLCRATGSTDMNASSSRSHAIFSVILKQQIWTPLSRPEDKGSENPPPEQAQADSTDGENPNSINQTFHYSPETHPDGAWRQLTSKFHFVDLAGSERLKRTNAEGDRKKEGISINQGLLALGNVISALGDESRKVSHVPYRDSKLTRMLQDSLGGNSQTLMLACISPSDSNYGETVNTLNYANRARNIRNRVVVNQEFFGSQTGGGGSAAEVRALRALVADLREEVAVLRAGGAGGKAGSLALSSHAAMDAAVVSKERQLQLQRQTERDLTSKLESTKNQLRLAEFDQERLGFRCNRLMERTKDLNEELANACVEKDAAIIELQKWRSGRLTLGSVPATATIATSAEATSATSPDRPVPSSGGGSPTLVAATPASAAVEIQVVASYNRTISELRVQLAEAEDRLAWYNEVMSELEGKKRPSNAATALRAPFDPSLDKPNNPSLDFVASTKGNDMELSHETRLLKALRNDPELGKVLADGGDKGTVKDSQISDLDNLKLYGLPRVSTTSWRPSSLSAGGENDSDEEDENDDDGVPELGYSEEAEQRDSEELARSKVALVGSMNALKNLTSGASLASLGSKASSDRSADIFLLIHRLQADISDHQAIVDRLTKREQEYEAMRGAYESKMNMLQTQVARIAHERDEALRRMKDPGSGNSFGGPRVGGGERIGSAAIRAKFDDEKRKLEVQIAELRKKLTEGARMQSSSKGRNDNLTKQLTATIEALKMEKAKMLKELKKENEKNRSLQTQKEREIARLRRKEKTAAEIAKKLERSNQLQRLMIKRRSDEMVNSHSKLKNVLSLLKRTHSGTGSRSSKVQKNSGMISPTKRPRSRQYRAPTPSLMVKELLNKLEGDAGRPNSPPPEVRAKFKKQMIEKELSSVVSFRLADAELSNLKSGLEKLFGEQRELLAERERCVAADTEKTGVYAPHLPQYMDERLGVLDLEIAMANARIKKAEDEMKMGRSLGSVSVLSPQNPEGEPLSPPSYIPSLSDGELSWENAINLLRSLDALELEFISSLLLEDLVSARVTLKSKETLISDNEKQVADLRMALQTMRGAALKTAMDYRKELEEVRREATRRIAEASGGSPPSKVVTPPTPRIQKMFDAAYGQGVILVPSQSRESLSEEPDSYSSLESKDEWIVEDNDKNAEYDPRRRGIAPAAAAALKSMRDSLELKAVNDTGNGGVQTLSNTDSPPRKPSFGSARTFTPPRGKIAAEAAAIGAAAVALAKIADNDQFHPTRRRSDNDALNQELDAPSNVVGSDVDSSPPRGRQGRQSSLQGVQGNNSTSPSRATDAKDLFLKKTLNTKRGPPLSPRSTSLSTTNNSANIPTNNPTANSNESSPPPIVARGGRSPTKGRQRSSSRSRKRSPSWTYGRESPDTTQAEGTKRKTSLSSFTDNAGSAASSIHVEELEEGEASGWQLFGLQSNSAWGSSSVSRPQSRTGKANKENVEVDPTLARFPSKKRSSSPLGRVPGLLVAGAIQPGQNTGDVFTRLATSHTLASQAKVIHRNHETEISTGGNIAVRIAQTCKTIGLQPVAVYTEDDAACIHVKRIETHLKLPGQGPAGYLNSNAIIDQCLRNKCAWVHPGYGFLSENAEFAEQLEKSGVGWIGPSPSALRLFGNKLHAKAFARKAGIPILEGTLEPTTKERMLEFIRTLPDGSEVMIKAIHGGGGRGMRRADEKNLGSSFERCQSEAKASFGNGSLYVERLAKACKHVEVQIVADRHGAVVALGERDCSLQRMHQKVVEIAPCPSLSLELRRNLHEAAIKLIKTCGSMGLFTIEFLVDTTAKLYYFMEVNPRLQVEHTITEELFNVDLVAMQIQIAQGKSLRELFQPQPQPPRGFAIQCRINAETIQANGVALPSRGVVTSYEPCTGKGVRVDSGVYSGYTLTTSFDSMIAKIIAHSSSQDFAVAVNKMLGCLQEFKLEGVQTNQGFLLSLLQLPEFKNPSFSVDTDFILNSIKSRALVTGEFNKLSKTYQSNGLGVQVVNSPLPGLLIELSVKTGDRIRKGQEVAVIQAMKMEHVIHAPCNGLVLETFLSVGKTLELNDEIITIRENGDGASQLEQGDGVKEQGIRPDLAELIERNIIISDEGRPKAVKSRHRKGMRTARENIFDLLDFESFAEYGALAIAAQRSRRDLQDLIENTPGDGMVCGIGILKSMKARQCAVLSYDFTVLAGTQGYWNHKKMDRLLSIVHKLKIPVVGFFEGGGGRPGDSDSFLVSVAGLNLESFHLFAALSGVVPLVGIAAGRVFAGNAAMLACCDVIIATENANIGMGGPAMIAGGGLGNFKADEIGPSDMQSRIGVVDIVVTDEKEAVAIVLKYLAFFLEKSTAFDAEDQALLRASVPLNRRRAYDMRIGGRPVGIFANDPMCGAGAIDFPGALKLARFAKLCNDFDIPLVSLCDTPGFLVGPQAEETGQVRAFGDLYIQFAKLRVPIFTVVIRRSVGLGAMAMAGGSFFASTFIISWPSGEFSGMGIEGAVQLAFRKELEGIKQIKTRKIDRSRAKPYSRTKIVQDDAQRSIKLYYEVMETSLGRIVLAASHDGLCFLNYADQAWGGKSESNQPLESHPLALLTWQKSLNANVTFIKIDDETVNPALDHLKASRDALNAFFSESKHEVDPFLSVKVDFSLSTPKASAFRVECWNALRQIPVGMTWDYEALATKCGKKGAARAAGTAVGSNPIPLIIPCHRIIGRNGAMRGYGFGGVEVKRKLLEMEKAIAV